MGNSTTPREVSMKAAEAFMSSCSVRGMSRKYAADLAGCSSYNVIRNWAKGTCTMHSPTRVHLSFVVEALGRGVNPKDIPRREKNKKAPKLLKAPSPPYNGTPTPPKPTRNSDDVEAYVALFSGLDKSTRWSVVHALLRTLEAK